MRRPTSLLPVLSGLATLCASLLLGLAAFLATPQAASAASCSLVMNLFDRNATNGGNTNPGGTSVSLAYNTGTTWTATTVTLGVGYTNETLLAVDTWALDPTGCAGVGKPYYYVMASRWHEAIYDKTAAGGDGSNSVSDNWASVDGIPATRFETTTFRADWVNDWTGFYNLDSPDTTVASGNSYTVYADITACDIAQGASVSGFSGQWARRSATAYGAFFWLAYGASNTASKYHNNTKELTGGGGKGFCANIVNTRWSPYFHAYDTIIYDTVAPVIGTFSAPATSSTATLTIGATDSSSPWLMAFSNSPSCDETSTSSAMWSNWETYATSRSGWAINTTAYGGSTGDGPKTVCIRVIDRAGNIAMRSLTVNYDTTAPVCAPVLDAGALWTASSTVSVAPVCTDASRLTDIRYSNNGSTWTPYETYAATKASWGITSATYGGTGAEGAKLVYVSARDEAGNVSVAASATIGLDLTGPVLSGITPGATTGPTNLPAYPVSFSVTDAGAGFARAMLSRASAPAVGSACPSPSAGDWSAYSTEQEATSGFLSLGLEHGTCYRWRIRAYDALDNSSSAFTEHLLVDQVAPVIGSLILGDGSGVTMMGSIPVAVSASDALSGVSGVRWSTESGYDWADAPWLDYATQRLTTLSLTGGGGDYGIIVQVRDAAGNIATSSGVIELNSTKRMPQVVLGARIVDCAAPATAVSVNTSGVIYWPVGKDLCFVPLAAGATEGYDEEGAVPLTGSVDPDASINFTLLSNNPCVAPCTGLVGRYPTAAVNQLRTYAAGSAATYLRLRLDRETTDADTSLTAVGIIVRVTVTVAWKNAAGVTVSTETYPVTLELRIRSLATGQRPG